MKHISSILWLIKRSIDLDLKLVKVSNWSNNKKAQFVLSKYFLLLKHLFIKFKFGESSIRLFGEKIYYDSPYGLADYQSILCRHQEWLRMGNVKNPKLIIDIGANVGTFSKMARWLYPFSKIYAIEPVPAVYNLLSKNFNRDRNTILFNFAVSNEKGKRKMIADEKDYLTSKFSNNGNFSIDTNTLDNFIREQGINDIDILKIDVETFENLVLLGAKQTLAKTKYLFLEVTVKDNSNYTFSSLISLLYSKKYNFQLIAISFINYAEIGKGAKPIMDCLFENVT